MTIYLVKFSEGLGFSQPLPHNISNIEEEIEMVINVSGSGQSAATVHQLPNVSSATPNETIGEGPKVLQFFYENPAESIRVGFTPVRVTSDEEVKGVAALVTEKADEYNKKFGLSEKPVQYLSSAVRARSLLLPEIVRHIDKCFTKKGIKEAQRGVRKRTCQPIPALIKIPSDQVVKLEEIIVDEELPQEKSGRERGDKVKEGHDDDATVDYEREAVKKNNSLDATKNAGHHDHAEQVGQDRGQGKHCEVRLVKVKLDELRRLQEVKGRLELGLGEEESSGEDPTLEIVVKEYAEEVTFKICEESKARCYVKLRKLNPELLPNPQEGDADETLAQTETEVPCLLDDKNLSKLFMKKNCVVKIAKMAWLDEASRRKRGQRKVKAKKTEVNTDVRLLDEDDRISHENKAEVEDKEARCTENPFWWM